MLIFESDAWPGIGSSFPGMLLDPLELSRALKVRLDALKGGRAGASSSGALRSHHRESGNRTGVYVDEG